MRSISSKITLSEGKGKEKKKTERRKNGGRKEKEMVALLGFILATLEKKTS